MNDFRSTNKKATKSASSSQVVPPAPTQPAPVQQQQQLHPDQQVRLHQDVRPCISLRFIRITLKILFSSAAAATTTVLDCVLSITIVHADAIFSSTSN